MKPSSRGAARAVGAALQAVSNPLPEMVDVVFDLSATILPDGYEWPLYQAIAKRASWMADSPYSGIHPIRGTRSSGGILFVAKRAKLAIRMPRDRVCAASILEGAVLDLGAATVRLGQGTFRRFRPAPTLYAARVTTGEADEGAFSERVGAELDALDIPRLFLCGRRADVMFEDRLQAAFSVAVHGLSDPQSLLLQRAGLGIARAVGCGVFVPHKTIVSTE
ncbi:MAG: type I-MYXAN CRISPR-associated protein Cas6/Cmx6 [Bacillota bacterium]